MSDGDENATGHGADGSGGSGPYGDHGPPYQYPHPQHQHPPHQPGHEPPSPWPVAGEQPVDGWGGGYDAEATGYVQLPPGGIPGLYGPDGWSATGGPGTHGEPGAYDDPLAAPLAAPGTGQGGYTPPSLGGADFGGMSGDGVPTGGVSTGAPGAGLGPPSDLQGPDVAGIHGDMGPVTVPGASGVPGAPGEPGGPGSPGGPSGSFDGPGGFSSGSGSAGPYGGPYPAPGSPAPGVPGPGPVDQWSMPFGFHEGPGAEQLGRPGPYDPAGVQDVTAASGPADTTPPVAWHPEPGPGDPPAAGDPAADEFSAAEPAMGQGAAAALAGSHEARTQRRPLGTGGAAEEDETEAADPGGAPEREYGRGLGDGSPNGRPGQPIGPGQPGQLPADEDFLADAHARRQVPFEGAGEASAADVAGTAPPGDSGGVSGNGSGGDSGGVGSGDTTDDDADTAASADAQPGSAEGDGASDAGGFAGLGTVRSGLPWAPSTPDATSSAPETPGASAVSEASADIAASPGASTGDPAPSAAAEAGRPDGAAWPLAEPNSPVPGAGWDGDEGRGPYHPADRPRMGADATAAKGADDAAPKVDRPDPSHPQPHPAQRPESSAPEETIESRESHEREKHDAPESDVPEPFEPFESSEDAAQPADDEHPRVSYVLHVNGVDRPVTDAWIGESLLYVLRERLGLAGAKDGCSQGECGACSVQVDGRLVVSCLVPAATSAGSEIRTVEGLAASGTPSDVQRAITESGAVQCGFCVPGLAMTVQDLLEGNHAPSELETRQAIAGNLCRCSGYRGVLDAVRTVVAERADRAAQEEAEADEETEQQSPPAAGTGEPHPGLPDQPGTPPPPHPHIPDQATDPAYGYDPGHDPGDNYGHEQGHDPGYGYDPDYGYDPAYGPGAVPDQAQPADQYGPWPGSPDDAEPARIPHQTGPGMWGGYGTEGGGT